VGNLSEHENLIERYLSEDNKEAAVQLLSELISLKISVIIKYKCS
jgi:hypothetical protein